MLSLGLWFGLLSSPWSPYVGYHWGVSAREKVRTGEENSSILKSKETMFKIGAPYRYSEIKKFSDAKLDALLWPELTIGDRLFGIAIGAGPEMQTSMGAGNSPLYLITGIQAGAYFAYLFSEGNLSSSVSQDSEGEISEKPYSDGDKMNMGVIWNLYFGPKFNLWDPYALKIQMNTQFILGKISPNSVQSSFSSKLGWTLGLNLQAEF